MDKRASTTKLLFEPEQISSVKDSLVKFQELAFEYFSTNDNPDEYSRAIALTERNKIWVDGVILGQWSDFDRNKDSIFHLYPQLNLIDIDKKGMFILLKFLNDNFISGIYYSLKNGSSSFRYCEEPFFGMSTLSSRIHKRIMLKSEFYGLSENIRKSILTYSLITDDKGDMLLLTNKEDLLYNVYGSEEKAPEKWKQPTDEIFHK